MTQQDVAVPAPPVSWKRGLAARVLPAAAVARLAAWNRRLRAMAALAANGWYDARRYWRWSSAGLSDAGLDHTQLAALVTLNWHRLEKGLALPAPRPGFGQDAALRLVALLDLYLERHGMDATAAAGVDTLSAWQDFNRPFGITNTRVAQALARYARHPRPAAGAEGGPEGGPKGGRVYGGTIPVTRAAVHAARPGDVDAFFATRHSVRQFTGEPVDHATLERAVALALHTPSVCNRQGWRVHAFTGAEQRARILAHQNGNRGFGDRAGAVLAVTADLRHFTSVGERYQGWIDGGLFAMTLAWAFHALGLGCCMLNWSVTRETDRALRREAGIPEHESVIMLMAVGHLPDTFTVARSQRKPLDAVLCMH
ncbi:nitroreductase [Azospirillum fermentarium]|uniref:nitroreductase family protein n=1 Tax=Azospirillum fermentarium TaxID=1233114 RepID=UPI002227EAA7|nr:nitroreductase family protein [Azospirillum fermentarium]MCW2247454.1 nitroreductase [Azospirillum fermentarium]